VIVVAALDVPRRLSALDNAFLAVESDAAPMHVSCLAVYRQDPASVEPPLALVCKNIEPVLEQMPELRRALIPGAPKLGRSYWGRPRRIELDRHVRVVDLPAPAGQDELLALAARLHSRRLSRARPLWEVWVIRGLTEAEGEPAGQSSGFAVLFKIHHAAVDGLTGMALFAGLHRRMPSDDPQTVGPALVIGPSSAARAVFDDVVQTFTGPMKSSIRIARGIGGRNPKPQDPAMLLPWTALNGTVVRAREVVAVSMPAEGVASARSLAVGSTANDVVLAVIGGALRRYFERAGSLPDRDLVAAVPIVRRRQATQTVGNDFDVLRVPLGVIEADARRRLADIQRRTASGKQQERQPPAAELSDGAELVPGWMLNLAVHASPALARLGAPMPAVNTIVSNVAGPRIPLYLGGAELTKVHALGPVANGLGAFHAVTSYRNTITLTITSSPSIITDLRGYAALVADEFRRLTELAGTSTEPDPPAPIPIRRSSTRRPGSSSTKQSR
jgi:diacylglycerol O-acyltransferase